MTSVDVNLATADELCAELGRRLRAQRLSHALTQQELAARCGMSTGAVKTLERSGQATVLTLMRVVIALGLAGELADLFAPRPQASIADMERAALAMRRRAPRRKPA